MVSHFGRRIGWVLHILTYNPATTLFNIYQGAKNLHPHKNQHTDVYSNFIHNCQNMEATKMYSVGE